MPWPLDQAPGTVPLHGDEANARVLGSGHVHTPSQSAKSLTPTREWPIRVSEVGRHARLFIRTKAQLGNSSLLASMVPQSKLFFSVLSQKTLRYRVIYSPQSTVKPANQLTDGAKSFSHLYTKVPGVCKVTLLSPRCKQWQQAQGSQAS